jgi:preprotein translocase subunit YajC
MSPLRRLPLPFPARVAFLVDPLFERGGDLAMFAPGCGLPLAGQWTGGKLEPPTARHKRAAVRTKAAQRCNWANDGYSPRRFCAQNLPFIPGGAPSMRGTMFITPAFAQSGGLFGGDSAGVLTSVMPLILIFVIMYFLILRPQQQKVKQHQAMVKALRRGDTVITSGGLVAKVTKVVDDDQIEVEIADGVRVRQMRSMVSDVRSKGEPVKDDSAS